MKDSSPGKVLESTLTGVLGPLVNSVPVESVMYKLGKRLSGLQVTEVDGGYDVTLELADVSKEAIRVELAHHSLHVTINETQMSDTGQVLNKSQKYSTYLPGSQAGGEANLSMGVLSIYVPRESESESVSSIIKVS